MSSTRQRGWSLGGRATTTPDTVVDISSPTLRKTHSTLPALQVSTDIGPLTQKASSQVNGMLAQNPHTSSCRSLHMELCIASPSVKLIRDELQISKSIPVFGENDRVGGQVVLDPSCHHSGRLSVTIEGTFQFTSSRTEAVGDPSYTGKETKDRHAFFTSAKVFSVSPISPVSPMAESPRPTSALRVRSLSTRMRRWPSVSSVDSAQGRGREPRSFPFQFDLPISQQPGQELPKTFSASALVGTGTRGRAFVESTSISYKITALWEPTDSHENRAQLEMPLLLLPNDGPPRDDSAAQPDFWLEMPLISSISVPFQSAITLPSPANFSRSATVPYYVVFTTAPNSLQLAKDIAINATISVTLVRHVSADVASRSYLPPSPPMSPSSSAEDSDSSSSYRMKPSRRRPFFGRVVSTPGPSRPSKILEEATSPINGGGEVRFGIHQNAQPLRSPNPPLSETRNLKCQVSEGFPKRPRRRKDEVQSTTERPKSGLPDGLFKGELKLDQDMLPSVDWAGISVKYYLEVSVLYRGHETRSRISLGIL